MGELGFLLSCQQHSLYWAPRGTSQVLSEVQRLLRSMFRTALHLEGT